MQDDAARHDRLATALGQRSSRGRLAFFLCELSTRDRDQKTGFDLPLTLTGTADTLGLTPIHLHRTFRALEADGLITSVGQTITILDIDRLKALADFERSGFGQGH